mgnify:CR=1 FL=1
MEFILQTLATGVGDSEAFLAIESDSDGEHIMRSNYQSSYDDPDDDNSDHILMPKLETTKLESSTSKTDGNHQGEETAENAATPPH